MTPSTVTPIDSTLQTTHVWLKDVEDELGYDNQEQAYHALRAVLHALRDRLTVEECADLAAQLPTLIRGIYYEGWRPAGKPRRERSAAEFLAHIRDDLKRDLELDPRETAEGVFRVLGRRVSQGEIDDVRSILPPAIRELWPTDEF